MHSAAHSAAASTAASQGAHVFGAQASNAAANPALAPTFGLPEAGLPQDRHARIAARRTFVALKQRFMAAVADLQGGRSDWLRFQVRQAHEPVDLWLLRGMVFEALGREGPTTDRTQRELSQVLASVFPNNAALLPYGVRA